MHENGVTSCIASEFLTEPSDTGSRDKSNFQCQTLASKLISHDHIHAAFQRLMKYIVPYIKFWKLVPTIRNYQCRNIYIYGLRKQLNSL